MTALGMVRGWRDGAERERTNGMENGVVIAWGKGV